VVAGLAQHQAPLDPTAHPPHHAGPLHPASSCHPGALQGQGQSTWLATRSNGCTPQARAHTARLLIGSVDQCAANARALSLHATGMVVCHTCMPAPSQRPKVLLATANKLLLGCLDRLCRRDAGRGQHMDLGQLDSGPLMCASRLLSHPQAQCTCHALSHCPPQQGPPSIGLASRQWDQGLRSGRVWPPTIPTGTLAPPTMRPR
jgi:hypothetical protein